MPNGGRGPAEWQMHKYYDGADAIRSAASEANYRKEWKEIIDYLYSYPSIGVWVPFNEAWDNSRLLKSRNGRKNTTQPSGKPCQWR